MINFDDTLAKRACTVPTVAKIFTGKEWLFCVVGTAYGHIHTTGGDVRTWRSYSGARRAAKNYVGF